MKKILRVRQTHAQCLIIIKVISIFILSFWRVLSRMCTTFSFFINKCFLNIPSDMVFLLFSFDI